MDNPYKIVYFGDYCKTCKHSKKKQEEHPCFECLDNSVNLYSHKPVKYEEDRKKND